MHSAAAIIDFTAARARRGLPPAPPPPAPEPAFRLSQPVTVLGQPLRSGWVIAISQCPRTGGLLYTVQTPTGRVVCGESRLLDGRRD